MDEKPVNTSEKPAMIFVGLLALIVGLMFFVPGIYFSKSIIMRFLQEHIFPDGPFAFIAIFTISIGTILLLLSYKFFFGDVAKQHVSTPILTFVSICFIAMSTVFALVAYVFNAMPTGYQTGRGIGGGFAIGCFGLWFAYKRKRGTSNQKDAPDQEPVR